MNQYIGVKVICAEPMNLVDAEEYLERKIKPGNEEGYLVQYEDGYKSWSPKDVFESAYRKTSGLTFGLAVEAMKKGFKVARAGWGGYWNLEKINILSEPTIVAYCKDGSIQAATPYQCDMLADDWVIVE